MVARQHLCEHVGEEALCISISSEALYAGLSLQGTRCSGLLITKLERA